MNLLEGFKEGKIGIRLHKITQNELDELDNLIDIRWASGARIRDKISYASQDKFMYYNLRDKCIYKSIYNQSIESIVSAQEFIDSCKNIKPIEEHDIMELFS